MVLSLRLHNWQRAFGLFLFHQGSPKTCGGEFLDTPQAGRGGEEHMHIGVLRAQEGHKATP